MPNGSSRIWLLIRFRIVVELLDQCKKGPLRGLRRTIHTIRIFGLLCTVLGHLQDFKIFRWDPTIFSAEDIRGVEGGKHAKNCGDRTGGFLKHCALPTGTFLLLIRKQARVFLKMFFFCSRNLKITQNLAKNLFLCNPYFKG